MDVGERASIPNPALKPFEQLIGEWKTMGSHPYLPGVILHGQASISWFSGGAFLLIRSEIDHPQFPQGIEIIGSDDAAKAFYMLHFDERGISRKYDVAFKDNELSWWRDDPAFSQRSILTIDDSGKSMKSAGEMSRDGGAWEGDLELTYERIEG